MNKNNSSLFWMFILIIFILTILRYSVNLFALSTYKEVFIVLAGGFLLIGLIMWLYKYFI